MVRFANVLRDMTDRQRAERLRKANTKPQEANALLTLLATQDGLTGA